MVWVVFISPFYVGERTGGMDCKSLRQTLRIGIWRPRERVKSTGAVTKTKKMGRLTEPAQTFRLCASEGELQTELDQVRKVDRVGNLPECCAGLGSVWRTELGMVKQVEELRAKLNIESLANIGLLKGREVEVRNALLTERSIHPGFVAEGPWVDLRPRRVHTAWRGEAGCIEPLGDARDGTSGNVFVASSDVVRSKRALSEQA